AAADAWLKKYRLGSNVKDRGCNSPWESGEPLADKLDAYNNGRLCAPHRDDVDCDGNGHDRDHDHHHGHGCRGR
ncbi:hypothetical protein BE18_02180, partial [Sorangium cellulosum]